MSENKYPDAANPSLVGTYPALTKAGGGYVWDEVLEYRVWCHPELGAPHEEGEGDDYYYAFATYEEAAQASKELAGAETPLALIRQTEYIAEPEPGIYQHIQEERLTEWQPEWLSRSRRTPATIPDFLSPNASANRLDVLRGLAGRDKGKS